MTTSRVRLERMVHGGVSLGRLANGRVVLVRGGIPGELVECEPVESAGVLRGDVLRILEGSPDRLSAPGHPGLDYGHISYPRQLELKREVVIDALRRAGGEGAPAVAVGPARAAPQIWRYRSAIQPAIARGGLGYRRPGSDELVELETDPVADATLDALWRRLKGRRFPKGVRELAMRSGEGGEALLALIATSPPRTLLPFAHELLAAGATGVFYARFDSRGRFRRGSERLAGARRIWQRFGEHTLSVTATSFAQPNPAAASELYRELATVAGSGSFAVELFAGSGAISLHLAHGFERVLAVEIDKGSVERGRQDAERLGVANLDFESADAREYALPDGADLIAVDPPRAGLSRELRERIAASWAQRLLYVSCDAATWARDVSDFRSRGWELQLAVPYDFYPHTHHVELLSLLVRRAPTAG